MRHLVNDFFENDDFLNPEWDDSTLPAVNVKDNEKNYEIELATPGYKKDALNVNIENGILTISAGQENEYEDKNDNYMRKEFNYTGFSRSFSLPDDVNEDEINASFKNGILLLKVSKQAKVESKVKGKRIEIS